MVARPTRMVAWLQLFRKFNQATNVKIANTSYALICYLLAYTHRRQGWCITPYPSTIYHPRTTNWVFFNHQTNLKDAILKDAILRDSIPFLKV
jgi:hypothetical protein